MVRSFIKSSENLVWSERMSMVIRVSLDSEENWAGKGVPRVHLIDGLVDSILVFVS